LKGVGRSWASTLSSEPGSLTGIKAYPLPGCFCLVEHLWRAVILGNVLPIVSSAGTTHKVVLLGVSVTPGADCPGVKTRPKPERLSVALLSGKCFFVGLARTSAICAAMSTSYALARILMKLLLVFTG
jgi:hypothetical protein